MSDPASIAAQQHAFWNGPQTRAWSEKHDRIDGTLAAVLTLLLDTARPQPGEQVLDIGCGSGTSLLALAGAVGPGGRVLGADIAEASVATARRRLAEAGMPQASVILADAATHPFPAAGFDLLFSRFGVMFFGDPVAAFAHLRRALRPGGRLAMAAFRAPAENPWATLALGAVRHLVARPPPPGPEEPGQFAFADPDRVRRILDGAGFRGVALTPADPPMRLGATATEAAEGATSFGVLARALNAAGATDALRAEVRAALVAFYRGHEGSRGVVLPGGIWLITARP
ncbi:class I SAM-dependent methyltransferase [Paracraurococcus ruber]|nr:class I SAM-dependent methyltransferase [Paracraurococcus ruber]